MEFTEEMECSSMMLEYLPSGVLFEICKLLSWQDVTHMGQTCRRFNELCKMATIWLQLRSLDFTRCSIPYGENILSIVRKCPQIEYLKLGDVLIEGNSDTDEDYEDTDSDRFLSEVLRHCSNLQSLDLSINDITDNSANAICARCEHLKSLRVKNNDLFSNEGIINLLSYLPFLTRLHIVRCTNAIPMLRHKDEGRLLSLTDVRIKSCQLYKGNLLTLLRSCVELRHLSLVENVILQGFPHVEPTEKTGLNTIKTLDIKSQDDMREVNLCQSDQLEMLKIKRCSQLLQVNMLAPKLHFFEIKECPKLKSVNLADVQLTEVHLSGFENLELIGIDSPVLKSLDISGCKSLSLDQFLLGIPNKRCVEYLNITGCSKISSSDINQILSQFSNLTTLIFGGEHMTTSEINSVDLTTLCFKKNKIMSCLPVNIASLKTLMFENCTGLTEQHLIDGMLFGEKKNHGVEGLETLIRQVHDYTPFKGRVGVPSIETLVLQHVPGLQGHLLSDSLCYFKQLTDVQLKHCVCLRELHIYNIPVLSTLTIESCNHLSTVRVHSVLNLQTMAMKWCSMIDSLHIDDVNLLQLDVTGCNFANFYLRSDSLPAISLSGVCTQPTHTLKLKCPKMTDLSIQKCNALEDVGLHGLFTDNPNITSLNLSVSDLVRCISIPSGVLSFSVTAMKRLQAIIMEQPIKIEHLKLNNLIKFTPSSRVDILQTCSQTLTKLEVRAIPKETELCLQLPHLESLTLDQGIDLFKLEIFCPKLLYLRIQGCPHLNHMLLQLNKLSQLQVNHSSPLLALKTMVLHVVHVQHVAHILAHYSCNLSTLELNGSKVTKEYLYELGRVIHKLSNIQLNQCELDEDLENCDNSFVIDGSEIGRNLSLTVNISSDMEVG